MQGATLGHRQRVTYIGLGLAIAIMLLWAVHFVLCVSAVILPWWQIVLGIVVQAFLHTGVFILGHDALHGNLAPSYPKLNRFFGQWAVGLYAGLSYDHCQGQHRKHHLAPATVADPDFHNGIQTKPHQWYCQFLSHYFSSRQFGGFLCFVVGMMVVLEWQDISFLRVVYFYLLPLCLSSLQLFSFGTYFPHGRGMGLALPPQTPRAIAYLWSLLSCYHFGVYHHVHHDYPCQPWFLLPTTETRKTPSPMP